jgi:anti-sigma factor (TIGR02949 family)
MLELQAEMQMSKTEQQDIGCLQAIEAFYAYLDGELENPQDIAEFEHHMTHCRSCYSRKEIESLLTARLRKSSKSQAPGTLQGRLRDLLQEFQETNK